MSDNFGKTDIESVLSSIRRLVSDAPADDVPAGTSVAERLVLTQEQRIDVPAKPPKQSVGESLGVLVLDDDDRRTDSGGPPRTTTELEARVAQLETALQEPVQPEETPAPKVQFTPVDNAIDPLVLGAGLWGVTNEAASEEGTIEHAVASVVEDAPQDDLPVTASADEWIGAPSTAVVDDPSIPFDGDDLVEAAVEDTADEALSVGALAPLAASGLIAEEDLRDMVSDIIRQELRGSLGVQMTHNMRKMVRREIFRIMASNSLK